MFRVGDRVSFRDNSRIYFGFVEGSEIMNNGYNTADKTYYHVRLDDGMLVCALEDLLVLIDHTNSEPSSIPEAIKEVIFNGDRTIIIWYNGAKTIVKCADDEMYDKYTGFCVAIVKMIFGSTANAQKFLASVEHDQNQNFIRKEEETELEKLVKRVNPENLIEALNEYKKTHQIGEKDE